MPTIYDIDFVQQTRDLLPPDKRDAKTKSLLSSLLSSAQWSRDLILGSYKTGAIAPVWSAGSYTKYYQVQYAGSVWYNLKAANTDMPGTTATWLLIQSNFLGVDERVKYSGVSIILEYAVNHKFGGMFRQPGSSSPSDIYFNNVAAVVTGWRIGASTGTNMGATTSDDSIGASYTFVQINNFNIESIGVEKIYIVDAKINPHAEVAILNADYIFIGPGNHLCSIIPNLVVSGVKEAILNSKAKLVYISNLTNKKGHTMKYTLSNYLLQMLFLDAL